MTIVIILGDILYWAAIIVGGVFAIGLALSFIGALFSKETWVQPAAQAKTVYEPSEPEVWFWRGVWGFFIVLLAVGVVGSSLGWIQ